MNDNNAPIGGYITVVGESGEPLHIVEIANVSTECSKVLDETCRMLNFDRDNMGLQMPPNCPGGAIILTRVLHKDEILMDGNIVQLIMTQYNARAREIYHAPLLKKKEQAPEEKEKKKITVLLKNHDGYYTYTLIGGYAASEAVLK